MKDFVNIEVLLKWWRSVDKYLLTSFFVLIFFGIFFIFSATPVIAQKIGLNKFYFVWKHFLYMIPTISVMMFISLLDAKSIKRICVVIFFLSLILMLLVPICGQEIKGARRWITFSFLTIQPSELMKFSFMVFSAWMFSENSEKFPGYKISTISMMLITFLLLLQPDLGMTILVLSSWIGQFFITTLSIYFIIFLFFSSCISLVGCYFIFPHVSSRIDKFLGVGENYQIQKSLESLYNGGFWGLGPGEGLVKRHLPDAHSDFIFSVIAEEFGAVVCIIIILLFATIIIRALIIAKRSHDKFLKLAIFGIIFMFGIQILINVSSALSLIPTKGMTLPFISYGGSSNFSIGIFAGILLGLTKVTINYNKYY